jgi:hypothetical protein
MEKGMRLFWWLTLATVLCGCEATGVRGGAAHARNAVPQLTSVLAGEYDNHEQVKQASTGIAVPHLRQTLRAVSGDGWWLWELRIVGNAAATPTVWLYRLSSDSRGSVTLTPFRAVDPAATTALTATDHRFDYVAAQWAQLAPCTMSGEWKGAQFFAAASVAACSSLLPGLGESAALLPLSLSLAGEMLDSTTFSDQARGADARIDARRVRWFGGWAAINGGGPRAKADSSDWHTRSDLRLSSEGGAVPVRWRDGAASGYSLELERKTYVERKLSVLQLNVIEDASGSVVDYVWASPDSAVIGLNMGWLQVGLTELASAKD